MSEKLVKKILHFKDIDNWHEPNEEEHQRDEEPNRSCEHAEVPERGIVHPVRAGQIVRRERHWNDYEDIALKLYERFGDDFSESKIYRLRFTDLLEWVLQIPNFEGTREQSNEGHLEMIQSSWVYEWRDNQKK